MTSPAENAQFSLGSIVLKNIRQVYVVGDYEIFIFSHKGMNYKTRKGQYLYIFILFLSDTRISLFYN